MTYIETIWLCLALPLLLASFFCKGQVKTLLQFYVIGTVVSLFASYCNSFVAAISGVPLMEATTNLTSVTEEILKAVPLVFYMLVFTPCAKHCWQAALALGLGVATFENACYLLGQGRVQPWFVVVRICSAGLLHMLCAALFGYAIYRLQLGKEQQCIAAPQGKQALAGTPQPCDCSAQDAPLFWLRVYAALSLCSSYHAIYNLLVTASGGWQVFGYLLPFGTAVGVLWYCRGRRIFKS